MCIIPKESLAQLGEMLKTDAKVSAVLVVKSKNSGKDFTYKINTSESEQYGHSVFIKYEASYGTYVGCARAYQGRAVVFKKFDGNDSPVIKGAQFVLDKLLTGNIDILDKVAEIHHTGNCIKCNRELTDLESINLGLGPVCRNY